MTGMGLGLGVGGGSNTLYGPLSFRDENTTARAAGSFLTTACEPGTGDREGADTETCISIIPNLSAAAATHAGVTFGGSNNRCSYATGYGWMDFPTGFNASLQAGLGRIVVMYDSSGRACWGFLGAVGSGESLDSNVFSGWDFTSGWTVFNSVTIIDSNSFSTTLGGAGLTKEIGDVGNLWKVIFSLSSTGGGMVTLDSAITAVASGGYQVNARSGGIIYLRNASGGTTDFSVLESYKVLTPSATGCWVYPTLEKALAGDTAQSGWNKPSAFNMNSATYTFGIHDPLSGGKKFYMGGYSTAAWGSPRDVRGTAITRAAGQLVVAKRTLTDVTNGFEFGVSNAKTGAMNGNSLRIVSDTCKPYDGTTAGPTICIPTDNMELTALIPLRAAGAHFFGKVGTGYWKYLWSTNTNNTATLYIGDGGYSQAFYEDWIRSPFLKWMMTPLISHSFTGSDATDIDGTTSNGLAHAETTGIGSGGSGVAADVVLGTAVITSNKATFTALTGGVGAVVWDVGNANTQTECVVQWAAGSVGMIVRWVDANNYIYADHDGTTAHLIKIVAGTPTTVGQLVTAYAGSKKIIVRSSLTKFSYWFNDVLIATLDLTIADAALQASTKIGIRSTDLGNTHDNLVSYATGDAGEYSVLSGLTGA